MKALNIFVALLLSSVSHAQEAAPTAPAATETTAATAITAPVEQEIDSFGGNEALYMKAQALNPEVQNDVVQNRFTKRTNRFEVAPEFASIFGGDSYNQTNNAGLNLHYHINPSWSVGVKYNYSFNNLTPEGKAMVAKAEQDAIQNPENPTSAFPAVLYPKSEMMGLVSWYPIVGKLSFGKLGVAHFDTYFTAGYGQLELGSTGKKQIGAGATPVASLGAGMGFWINSNVTTRVEYRAQQYTAEYYTGEQNMVTSVASVQLGWML